MFLLDHFPKEVHSRFNLTTADRTAIENPLLELIPIEDLLDALEDWADRTGQRFLTADELETDDEGRHELARRRRPSLPRSGLIDRVRTACELWERSNKSKGPAHSEAHAAWSAVRVPCQLRRRRLPVLLCTRCQRAVANGWDAGEFQRIIAFRQVSVSMPAVLVYGRQADLRGVGPCSC